MIPHVIQLELADCTVLKNSRRSSSGANMRLTLRDQPMNFDC